MIQLDGTSESKVADPQQTPESPPSRAKGVKKRCVDVFKPKKRSQTIQNNAKVADTEKMGEETPLRIVSPRTTDQEPAPSAVKQRAFSFKKRHTNRRSGASLSESAQEEQNAGSATDISFQSPARRQSMAIGMNELPASPTREAALTSHPIVREGERREEGEERFKMPLTIRE